MVNVLTLEEVASYLRVHPSTVYRMLKKGQIPAFKVGSDWRFNLESIDHWRAAAEHGYANKAQWKPRILELKQSPSCPQCNSRVKELGLAQPWGVDGRLLASHATAPSTGSFRMQGPHSAHASSSWSITRTPAIGASMSRQPLHTNRLPLELTSAQIAATVAASPIKPTSTKSFT
jgi:excisionase family DNA binding protein